MNWVDYTIIGIIVFSALISVVRGFSKEVLSLASWVLAFIITWKFYDVVADYLINIGNELMRTAIAVAALFLVSVIVLSWLSVMISTLIHKTGLSGTDRVLGACFGIVRGFFIIAIVLFFVDTFTPLSKSQHWKESLLIPHFDFIIKWFFEYLKSSSSFLMSTGK